MAASAYMAITKSYFIDSKSTKPGHLPTGPCGHRPSGDQWHASSVANGVACCAVASVGEASLRR